MSTDFNIAASADNSVSQSIISSTRGREMAIRSAFCVAVVIVNYRTAQLTIDCLEALMPQVLELSARVLVVEGGSGDDSATVLGERIARSWPDRVELIVSDQNRGFAAGNNIALNRLRGTGGMPEHVLLLNPDTIPRAGAVVELLNAMKASSSVGIAGSRLEDPDGTPQPSAFRFPGILSEFEDRLALGVVTKLLRRWIVAPPVRSENHATHWLAGASMIVRREVLESIGMLDENFFLYFEETDFCLRAARAGWPCEYVPSSRVVHLVGQSTGVTNTLQPPRRRPCYWFESRRYYFAKNYGIIYLWLVNLSWLLGYALWRLRIEILRRPYDLPPHFARDFLRYSFIARRSSGRSA